MDPLECVWTSGTISLKQVDIVTCRHIWTPDNHKSKAYNRHTKTREKGTQTYH